jgi:hypothetical protein
MTFAAVLQASVKLPCASLHGFHHRQACRGRHDVAHLPASSPEPCRPCSDVAMDDLIHRAAAPRAAIKGGPPLSNPSHHQLPLSSLTLLDHIPLHISHRSSLIACRSTVEPPQKEKKIAAAPGDATCTRQTVVVDNVVAHLADHRRSTGELSDPLPTPPVSSRLAGDDDAREPLDRVLILRPRKELTVSLVMRH